MLPNQIALRAAVCQIGHARLNDHNAPLHITLICPPFLDVLTCFSHTADAGKWFIFNFSNGVSHINDTGGNLSPQHTGPIYERAGNTAYRKSELQLVLLETDHW